MKQLKVQITPLSAFATKLTGDTLFGQFCSFLAKKDVELLNSMLDKYTQGQPFIVFSDAFPSDSIPRPTIPSFFYEKPSGKDRKQQKKLSWINVDKTTEDISKWLLLAHEEKLISSTSVSHNHINRLTSSTDNEGFAPYTVEQYYYGTRDKTITLDVYVVYDENLISIDLIQEILRQIGLYGYGKDATIGMGKFEISYIVDNFQFKKSNLANAYLSLAPSTPEAGYDTNKSFYTTIVKFAKAGADIAITTGNPYKNPILMAKTAGIFTPNEFIADKLFIGKGLGGDGSISKSFKKIVHQGYSPIVPVYFSNKEFE